MNSGMYAEMVTPASRRDAVEMQEEESAVEGVETASQINRAFRIESSVERHQVQFNGVTTSDRSSRVSRSEMGRSLARVYEPTLQERAQHFLKGPSGLYLELVNLACSCVIFALYIVELYHPTLEAVAVKRAVEVGLTSFFIFDLGLHLLVAPNPVQYLMSIYGIIDVITIIPSFLMYFTRSTKSQTFFILRVLRIFRALRVLRLKRFIKFKRHGFNYELSVFILSAVAVILCAAGMYQAMEEAYYLDQEESFYFHEALYFILVTMSTVGYGDISPHTTLGKIFVMLLIIAVFTVVPQKATKLNELAKQNHQYDKDYIRKSSKKSGHVVVSGQDLTVDSILDFLDEFYHASRGNIHLDVVFMCESPPSPAILRLLAMDRFAQRTRYLRGSLSNGNDQSRARLGEATAVFFLANKHVRQESAQQDARTVLQTLAVRNFADSSGKHTDIYLQLRSREQELEMTAQLLGSNTTNTSELQTMILSRSAVCPGASTLILNLLHSVSVSEYARRQKNVKNWIEEYVDGMSFQVFPIIFSKKFQYESYDDVVQNIYEHYNAIVVMVRSRRRRRASNVSSSAETEFKIAPFQTIIREGDIGIVLAKTAADVLHILNTYGFWSEGNIARDRLSPNSAKHVRVSTDSLMKRPSPKSGLQAGKSALSLLEQSRSFRGTEVCLSRDDITEVSDLSGLPSFKSALPRAARLSSFSNVSRLGKIDEVSSVDVTSCADETRTVMPIIQAVRARDLAEVQDVLERDHSIHDAGHLEDHFVISGGRLRDALSIVAFIKRFCSCEHGAVAAYRSHFLGAALRFPVLPRFVLLVEQHPTASDMIKVLSMKEEYGEDISNAIHNVVFVCGRPSRAGDLRRAAIDKACRVIMLPQPSPASQLKLKPVSPHKMASSSDADTVRHENLSDFGVINSLLIAEVVREEAALGIGGKLSPRRRHSSRQYLHSQGIGGVDNSLAFYRRELDQGLPLESIKVRMLERYPDLEPKMFNQDLEVIETSLHQYDSDSSAIEGSSDIGMTDSNQRSGDGPDDVNTIALLYHASSAKFCRPRDPAVIHDKFPCLAPSFAGGDVFLSSVLDRIVCQAFYNPYVTDVVRLLACGDMPTEGFEPTGPIPPPRSTSSTHSRRLFQVAVDDSYVGANFESVFRDYLALKMLVIGILRSPNPSLENLRPFVYTCPTPDTTLHQHDRLFILG